MTRFPRLEAGCLGRPREGCASSHIPDPLSHPFPPPPLSPTPGQAARAPAFGGATRESTPWTTAGGCTRCLSLWGTLRKTTPSPLSLSTPECASSGSHELMSTCWQLQFQAEPLRPSPHPPFCPPLRPVPEPYGGREAGVQTGVNGRSHTLVKGL